MISDPTADFTDKIILLVEDNQGDVDLMWRAFEKNHIANELIVAEDGQEALDYLFGTAAEPDHPTPALVLLDLKLPKVDGLGVLRRIRADDRTRRIPVIILTSTKEEQDVAQSYDYGANSFIRKPVDFNRFVKAVNHLTLYWLVLNEQPPRVSAVGGLHDRHQNHTPVDRGRRRKRRRPDRPSF